MINTIVDKLAILVDTALPLYTQVDGFYTQVKDIDGGKYPYAMVFDPTVITTPLRDGQREDIITVSVLLIRQHSEGVEIRDDLDAVVAALDADPTLTTSVDVVRAEQYGSAERQTARTTGGIVIEIKVVN